MSNTRISISQIISAQAKERPGKVAIRTSSGVTTYAKLEERTMRCATTLVRKGILEHEICGISITSPVLLLIVRLALSRLGICSVSIPPGFSRLQIEKAVANSGLTKVIANHDLPADDGLCLQITSQGVLSSLVMDPLTVRQPSAVWDMITIGSGTTGEPKLIALTADQVLKTVTRVAESFSYGERDIVLCTTRLEYGMSLRRTLAILSKGGTCYLQIASDEDLIDTIQRRQVTCVTSTVYQSEVLLKLAKDKPDPRLPSVRLFETGSSFVSEGLIQRLKETFTDNVLVQYGTNECPNVCDRDTTKGPQHPNSIGNIVPTASLEIVDDNGSRVAVGMPGHIRIRAPGMALSYPNSPENTKKFFRDGWFHPGDVGRVGEDGQFYFLGRSDDMMIFNGINIFPAEIERVVADHPAVADVVVMPYRHEVHQDVPLCAVSIRPGCSVDKDTLTTHAKKRLGARNFQNLFIIDEIPRNDLGKVVRKEMVRIFSSELAQASKGD